MRPNGSYPFRRVSFLTISLVSSVRDRILDTMTTTTTPSQCRSPSSDPDRHSGQGQPPTIHFTDVPNANGRDADPDSTPTNPVVDARPQPSPNPVVPERSTDAHGPDDHYLLPLPAAAASEIEESPQQGGTEAPEEDKLDWIDDACEYWAERYTSLRMRIEMMRDRQKRGRSIDENKLRYYRKINYEIQKKRKRERDVKRAALKKDVEP